MCRCEEFTELWDDEAKNYISTHLELIETQGDGWKVLYHCPKTGRQWQEDYPRSEEHGGGLMRLRKLQDGNNRT